MSTPALRVLTVKDAEIICGKLSDTTKMPGYSYGTPAEHCKRGSKLRNIKGSVCEKCYAMKGRYNFPPVKKAYERRFVGMQHPLWVVAMIVLIKHYVSHKKPYFRWFDSGDLQSAKDLENIMEVCRACPEVKFWLPTREQSIVKAAKNVPNNLVIRVSASMIDGGPPPGFKHTSTVTTGEFTCPAPTQDNACGNCRACWDKRVRNVAYHKH